jgi:hypothetical protein
METAYPHLVPIVATVVTTNVLPSGAAFGVRLDDGTSCYIPTNVARAVGATLGADFSARLVPNRFSKTDNFTPWLAIHLTRAAEGGPVQPVQYAMPFGPDDAEGLDGPTVGERVRETMRGGGVWTERTMYDHLFPGASRGTGSADYAAVRGALRQMFSAGECAKFAMWYRVDQGAPSRVWYTCYPDRADVDEWEDADSEAEARA